jgi:hypothetical protein
MEEENCKSPQEKHSKYEEQYKDYNEDTEYWGLGIENESYLMLENKRQVNKNFILNNQKRERYSVDYWKNFNPEIIKTTLAKLPERDYNLPVYINSYFLQYSDFYGEPISRYSKKSEPNTNFCGETIDSIIQKNKIISDLFEKNMIYDGDTIEFTTYYFYKSTVNKVISELKDTKLKFIGELNNIIENKIKLDNKKNIFTSKVIYPDLNYGFAIFQSNINNLAICNNGTYHINITLPTQIKDGEILDPIKFKNDHSNAIRAIQWIEPLLIALYGTPDIFNLLNSKFAGGSLRLALSRYISIGTFDSDIMKKGKQLNNFDYSAIQDHFFTRLHENNSPYIPPKTIGYDINYNKFKKHGIELRFFDYFPEEYLEDVINLIILICQYSNYKYIEDPLDNKLWQDLAINTIKFGSCAVIDNLTEIQLYKLFGMKLVCRYNILDILQAIADHLYSKYHKHDIANKLSPNMKKIKITNYNNIVKMKFCELLGIEYITKSPKNKKTKRCGWCCLL